MQYTDAKPCLYLRANSIFIILIWFSPSIYLTTFAAHFFVFCFFDAFLTWQSSTWLPLRIRCTSTSWFRNPCPAALIPCLGESFPMALSVQVLTSMLRTLAWCTSTTISGMRRQRKWTKQGYGSLIQPRATQEETTSTSGLRVKIKDMSISLDGPNPNTSLVF